MSDDLLLLERHSENRHIAILTLNRPQAGNALNTPLVEALAERFDEIDRDTSIRVMIMRANGKHASFGADLNELVVKTADGYANMSRQDAEKHVRDGRIAAKRLFHLRVPTIAIVHGFCLGGGAEFYTLCDVMYGASGGKEEGGLVYGFPEPTIGVMAGWMGPEILAKRIGAGPARSLLLSGRMIGAEEALKMGVVQELHPKEELLSAAVKWAGQVAASAPLAVESTRRTLNRVRFPHFDEVCDSSGAETVENLMSADFVRGAIKILTKSKEQPAYERR
jgi:enoyl-CoA hydratase/carnithine racemase